VPISDWR